MAQKGQLLDRFVLRALAEQTRCANRIDRNEVSPEALHVPSVVEMISDIAIETTVG
jgi:hypothetical protein